MIQAKSYRQHNRIGFLVVLLLLRLVLVLVLDLYLNLNLNSERIVSVLQ